MNVLNWIEARPGLFALIGFPLYGIAFAINSWYLAFGYLSFITVMTCYSLFKAYKNR